jgi:prevent-host-death family protein
VETVPSIVPITDLRRDTAGVIGRAAAAGDTVFVTQKGRVTAVLLPRARYDGLLRLLAEEQETAPDCEPAPPPPRNAAPAGFPSTRQRVLVQSQYGLVDPETAAFFAEQGIWTEDQGDPPLR